MTESHTKNVIEAALLAAGRPLNIAELSELFDELGRPDTAALREALAALEQDYTGRGIEVKETANGFRIQVRRDLANEISRLWPERPPRYSRALLETLALIAYRQPITRAEIEAVRGVAVNPNIIKTVIERNWVRVVGNRDVPGRPELLGTTKDFLDYFGLRSLEELPPLAELKAMGDVNLQLDLAKDVAGDAAAAGVAAGGAAAVASNDAVASDGEEGAAPVAADATVAADDSRASDAEARAATDDAVAESMDAEQAADDEHDADPDADADADARADAETLEADARADSETLEADARADAETLEAGERKAGAEMKADARASGTEPGPQAKAAEAFLAELEEDADALGSDDSDADDDELSAADRDDSGELVAAPPRYDD